MELTFGAKHRLSDFDNVLVVNDQGEILYYDVADLNILAKMGLRPEEFLGAKVTSFYTNLHEENSTVMQVIQTGMPLLDVKQHLKTKSGGEHISNSSTYPIIEDGKVIGAIEFSKHSYYTDDIHYMDDYANHKVYRKNNTVYTIDDLIGDSTVMKTVKDRIQRVSKQDSTVLLVGKTGTGKEVVAQAIHNSSKRYTAPFISVNIGALPEQMMEQTLFGTAKGKFPGLEDVPGIFEQAEGGTLFLDEINALPLHLQTKLLKVIEDKTVRRIGGNEELRLNIRIISATNEHPDTLLTEKRLRDDLYFRLSVVQIELPELKQHKEDLEPLLEHFIQTYNSRMESSIVRVEEEVLECFQYYDWPGNVRELKNAVEYAFHHSEDQIMTVEDLPDKIRQSDDFSNEVRKAKKIGALKDALDEYEKAIIEKELRDAGGVIAETARRLGLSKQALKYKMDKYEMR